MKDRFTLYGIIIMIVYISWYMWNQGATIIKLENTLYDQYDATIQLREAIYQQDKIIQLQKQYINELEMEYNKNLFRQSPPSINGPI